MHRKLFLIALAFGLSPALAETSQVSPTGFISTFREEVRATPDEVWKTIVQLPRWWNDQHTWSGKAANMSLDLQAGGCWCERWGDGQSVMHGQVAMLQPGRVLRLFANLGPLQAADANGLRLPAGVLGIVLIVFSIYAATIDLLKGAPGIRTENALLSAYIYVDIRERDIGGYVRDAQRARRLRVPTDHERQVPSDRRGEATKTFYAALTPEQQIKALQVQLKLANEKAQLFEAMLDVLKKDYGVRVVKKPLGKSSRSSSSKG